MRRIYLVTVVVLILGALIFAYSQVPLPTPQKGQAKALRRIKVNAQTISSLPSGKKYVVDLTQLGVKYEFDRKAGHIDFDRVSVRTDRGEVTMGSFLEKNLPKDKLPALNNTSLALSFLTRATGTVQTPSRNTSKIIDCHEPYLCSCEGESSCQELLDSTLCSGRIVCVKLEKYPIFCACGTDH